MSPSQSKRLDRRADSATTFRTMLRIEFGTDFDATDELLSGAQEFALADPAPGWWWRAVAYVKEASA